MNIDTISTLITIRNFLHQQYNSFGTIDKAKLRKVNELIGKLDTLIVDKSLELDFSNLEFDQTAHLKRILENKVFPMHTSGYVKVTNFPHIEKEEQGVGSSLSQEEEARLLKEELDEHLKDRDFTIIVQNTNDIVKQVENDMVEQVQEEFGKQMVKEAIEAIKAAAEELEVENKPKKKKNGLVKRSKLNKQDEDKSNLSE